jgi:hypothetical protein
MKIWYQHGSEHSANLVMIGHFKSALEATQVKEIIDALTRQVSEDHAVGTHTLGSASDRYSDAILDLFSRYDVAAIGPQEVDQFASDVSIKIEDNDLVLTTDEFDISAFLKVMVLKGARIEVYSAHHHSATAYGKGR